MMNKDNLLAQMEAYWQRLINALEGVAHADLEQAKLNETWTVKEMLCALTAWDGEALRRISFCQDKDAKPVHNPVDMAYWQSWERKQVEIKKIMPAKGVMVDLVGTRQRLMTKVDGLSPDEFLRWVKIDPQAVNPTFKAYIPQIERWRKLWDEAHPPKRGVVKWWASLRGKGE